MAVATLRALAVEWGKAGESEIDELTVTSGFLRAAGAIPASHGLIHKAKKVDSLPSFSVINPGGSVGDTTVDSNLVDFNLKNIEAHQSEPVDIVKNWPTGKAAYFNSQMPSYREAFGQKASVVSFYGIDSTFGDVGGWYGLHAYAKAYSNVTQMAGTTGARTSIFAVKFRPGPNGCGLLYNPNVASGAALMESEVQSGGNSVLETTNTTGLLKKRSYQVVHSGYMGFLSTSSFDVAAISQIEDAADDRPTAANMDLMLDRVRFNENTFIFMNRAARRMLQLLNASALATTTVSTDYYKYFENWNGVPIIIDDNISSVETTVLD